MRCERPVYPQRDYCIFHIPDKNEKEVADFEAAFDHEIERQSKENPDWFDFQGFHFPYGVSAEMLRAKMAGKRPTIAQQLNFVESYFHGGAWFENTTFQARATFSYATFGGALFKNVSFERDAAFNDAKFRLGWFENAEFHGMAEFSGAAFDEGAFENAMFMARARFVGTEFRETVHFDRAKFQNEAWFSGARFGGDAWFEDAMFLERMWFLGAVFQQWTVFSGVTSCGVAWFEDTKFGKYTKFIDAKFLGYTSFNDTEFRGETLFAGARFHEELYMCPVSIRPEERSESVICFVKTQFEGRVELDWSGILGATVSSVLILKACAFGENAKMIIRGAVGCFSLHTDLSKTEFLDEDWRERIDLLGSVKPKHRRAVLDEYILDRMARSETRIPPSLSYVNTDSVAQLYRRLRHNYEASKRYAEAGEFFVGEMEVLRKYRTVQMVSLPAKTKASAGGKGGGPRVTVESWESAGSRVQRRLDWYRFLLLEPYKWLALYGERVGRPAFWAVFIIAVFTVVRPPLPTMLSSVFSSFPALTAANVTATWNATMEPLKDSIFAFFQLSGGQTGYDLAERLFSAPILGLLFIAIRRKLERH
jgi:hypothetical protein